MGVAVVIMFGAPAIALAFLWFVKRFVRSIMHDGDDDDFWHRPHSPS